MKMEEAKPSMTVRMLWQRNGLIWLALLSLLTLSSLLAYVPMGFLTPTSGIAIAFVKAGLVLLFFMELNQSRPLIRLAAVSGLVFVSALFVLTLSDVLVRLLR